jgi:hypothetical protein
LFSKADRISSVTAKTFKGKGSKTKKLQPKSVSRIQFDDTAKVLFAADWKQEMIFAFELHCIRKIP